MVWTNPDELEVTPGVDRGRAADWAAVLDNLRFLYERPTTIVRLTAAQSVAASSDALIEWDEAQWDDDGMWDAGTPGSVVAQRDGIHLIEFGSLFGETTSADLSRRAGFLEVNGTTRLAGHQQRNAQPSEFQVVRRTELAVGDYIEAVARHTFTDALDLQPLRTFMSVTWVGPPRTGV